MKHDGDENGKGCVVCSDKERAENVKKAVELIKGSTVEELLDYSAKDGYVNGSFIQGGREFSFYINSLNGNYEYNLVSRQSPFSATGIVNGAGSGSSVNFGSLDSQPESKEGNMYDRADGYQVKNYDIDSVLDDLRNDGGISGSRGSRYSNREFDGYGNNINYYGNSSDLGDNYDDDGESDPEDLENPRNRARVLTEIIESEYGKGGIDKIIKYGMKDDNNIAGEFEANGQKFDFNINLSRNQLTYSPILTEQQKETLARNKDSIDRYVLGENLAKAEVMGLRIDGKDPEYVNPYKVMGYLMEMEPAPFF